MPKITLNGTSWDGEYGIDLATLNGRELHLVKQVSGVRLGELEDALMAEDYDLYIALAAICVVRDNKAPKEAAKLITDALLEGAAGTLFVDWTDEDDAEDDAGPPAVRPNGPSGSGPSSTPSSDADSADSPETTPASTGAAA